MNMRRLLLTLCLSALCGAQGGIARAVEPSPAGPALGSIISQIFAANHYERRPVDATMSTQALRSVLESYDYAHLFFTQADVDNFEVRFGPSLGARVRTGDVGAAYAIYDRFMERLTERRTLITALTASTVTFTAAESIPREGHKLPWPTTDAAMFERWRLNIKFELLRASLDGTKGEDPVKTVISHYDSLVENYKQFDADDILQNFLSALCRVYDPHSDYLSAPKEDNFNIGMRLSLVGIGAALRSEKGYTSVVSLVPGGPAELDKRLRAGDKIIAVAQGDEDFVDLTGMKIDRVVRLIRGGVGTVVQLRILPVDAADPSTRVVIRLVRAQIHLRDQEAKAELRTVLDHDGKPRLLGIIDLPSFYADLQAHGEGKSTTRDVAALLASLRKKGAEGLILDLRRNGGGSLQEALELTGIFIGAGPVVQVKDNGGSVSVLDSGTRNASYEDPVIVLSSRGSASASEILAAALQDYGRAVVVGPKSTFGKGTVQTVLDLGRYMPPSLASFKAGAVHLTIQKFYRISGGSTQNRGVIPDIALPSAEDEMEITESSLPNALSFDRISPAPFTPQARVGRLLPGLVRASQERVGSSPEWAYALEDIESFRKEMKQSSISLNEIERRAEKAADEARDDKRRKERTARARTLPPAKAPLYITLSELDGVAPSTTTAAVAPTNAPQEKKPDYETAPPAPDLMLVEALNILNDMVTRTRPQETSGGVVLTP